MRNLFFEFSLVLKGRHISVHRLGCSVSTFQGTFPRSASLVPTLCVGMHMDSFPGSHAEAAVVQPQPAILQPHSLQQIKPLARSLSTVLWQYELLKFLRVMDDF